LALIPRGPLLRIKLGSELKHPITHFSAFYNKIGTFSIAGRLNLKSQVCIPIDGLDGLRGDHTRVDQKDSGAHGNPRS